MRGNKLLSSQVAVFRRHVCLQLAAARFVLCMITCGWPCRVDYCLSGKAEAGAAVACNCRAPNCRGAL